MTPKASALATSALLLLSILRPAGATIRTVTNLNDSGAGSLREAISVSAAGDTIEFSVSGIVDVTSGELLIDKSLSIIGPSDSLLYFASNQSERILHVTGGTVTFSNINIFSGGAVGVAGAAGSADNKDGGTGEQGVGGGLYNSGTVTFTNCTFFSNVARGGSGGAPYGNGRGGDGAPGKGGAIYNQGNLTLVQCTFFNNVASGGNASDGGNSGLDGDGGEGGPGEGAAIHNDGEITLINCTLSGNYSTGGYGGAGLIAGDGGDASGGGIFQGSGSINFLNTIVAKNTLLPGIGASNLGSGGTSAAGDAVGPDVASVDGLVSLGHNLIGISDGSTGWSGADMLGTTDSPLDPLLDLFGNFDPGNVMPLLIDSRAIDAGDDTILESPYSITNDARERLRKLGAHVDVGATEFDPPQPGPNFVVTNLLDHFDESPGTYDCTLREALGFSGAFPNPTITFAPGLTGTLQIRPIRFKENPVSHFLIDHAVTISGPGPSIITINGGPNLGKIFEADSSDLTISGLTLANSQAGPGPAIASYRNCTVTNCAFNNNQTVDDGSRTLIGGAIYTGSPGNLTVSNCTFDHNSAREAGGAIAIIDALATITNCTFNGNSAYEGGALYAAKLFTSATLSLNSCTISGNNTSGGDNKGGGVYAASGVVNIANTILAANNAAGGAPDALGAFASGGHNLIGILDNNASGFSAIIADQFGTSSSPLDPNLNPLDANGGQTLTMALRSDSLAINAAAGAPERDQRGYARPDTPDIGAYEFGGTIPATLANISTRVLVETGDNVLIGGFIVTGTHPKTVILRAIGPSLPVPGALSDPSLELHDGMGATIATNDNWTTNSNVADIVATGLAPANQLESAILSTLPPGAYTAIVRGANGVTGVALIEAYDLDRTTDAKLANISTRALVQTGDNVMIGGFIVLGPDSQEVLVRGIGPSLPIGGVLTDPSLELHDGSGEIIAANDDWRSDQEEEIAATGIPPAGDKESALLTILPPAAYTAVLRGKANTTGIGLVEVYGLSP